MFRQRHSTRKSYSLVAAPPLVLGSILAANANAWYPEDCKTVDYCGTVETVALVASVNEGEPQLLVTSKQGKAVVRRGFLVRESVDGRLHVCMRYDPFGDLEVTCLLVPARAF